MDSNQNKLRLIILIAVVLILLGLGTWMFFGTKIGSQVSTGSTGLKAPGTSTSNGVATAPVNVTVTPNSAIWTAQTCAPQVADTTVKLTLQKPLGKNTSGQQEYSIMGQSTKTIDQLLATFRTCAATQGLVITEDKNGKIVASNAAREVTLAGQALAGSGLTPLPGFSSGSGFAEILVVK